MEVEKYNLLTENNVKFPKYKPNLKYRCIRISYVDDNDIILIGDLDPNYIYWLSVTKLNDTETNKKIFDYVSQLEPLLFSTDALVLETMTKYSYQQFRSFYTVQIERAEDILPHYQECKIKCKNFESKKRLLATMQHYLTALSRCHGNAVSDYKRNESIIKEIKSYKYLRLSDNPQVRELYNELDKCCANLYNAYMTEAR